MRAYLQSASLQKRQPQTQFHKHQLTATNTDLKAEKAAALTERKIQHILSSSPQHHSLQSERASLTP